MDQNKYSKIAALSTVIANMIGVGVFSSLGFQVIPFESGGIPDGFSILLIWERASSAGSTDSSPSWALERCTRAMRDRRRMPSLLACVALMCAPSRNVG